MLLLPPAVYLKPELSYVRMTRFEKNKIAHVAECVLRTWLVTSDIVFEQR